MELEVFGGSDAVIRVEREWKESLYVAVGVRVGDGIEERKVFGSENLCALMLRSE